MSAPILSIVLTVMMLAALAMWVPLLEVLASYTRHGRSAAQSVRQPPATPHPQRRRADLQETIRKPGRVA